MASRVSHTTVNCLNAYELSEFSTGRLGSPIGHVGATTLMQIRETIADLLDL